MKRSEIEIGGIYGNGKGSRRVVLGFPVNHPYAQTANGVLYKVLYSRSRAHIGRINLITAHSFIRWAKSREN